MPRQPGNPLTGLEIPETVSREMALEALPERIRKSDLFHDALGQAEDYHGKEVRKNRVPVLEGHTYQTLWLMGQIERRTGIRFWPAFYAAMALHDSLEAVMPKKKKTRTAMAKVESRAAAIGKLGRHKEEDGNLVLMLVSSLTRPSPDDFFAQTREGRERRAEKAYMRQVRFGHPLLQYHPLMETDLRKRILKQLRILKIIDSSSNLAAPVLSQQARERMLRKARAYVKLAWQEPDLQRFYKALMRRARQAPVERRRSWIGGFSKPILPRAVGTHGTGLTVVEGPLSTAILWKNVGEDPHRFLLENIRIRKKFPKGRPSAPGKPQPLRGNVLTLVGFGPKKERVLYKPVDTRKLPVLEKMDPRRHPAFEVMAAHDLEKRPGFEQANARPETPFGMVIDHSKRRPEIHLLVPAAPDGSQFGKISGEDFKRVTQGLRDAGYVLWPGRFVPSRNVLSQRDNHMLVDVQGLRHKTPWQLLEKSREELPWFKELETQLQWYGHQTRKVVGNGERERGGRRPAK